MRSVPTETFGPILARLIADRFADDPESGIAITAEKAGCDWTTVANIITQKRETCDFNTADELLCALGQPQLWRTEPLSDIYFNIDLSWTVCQNPGCKVEFQQPSYQGRFKKYCSDTCRTSHARIKRGFNYRRRKSGFSLMCRNGHKRTPNNTIFEQENGRTYIRCRDCRRASANAAYRRRNEQKCRNGHPRTPENTSVRKNGKIECAVCKRDANRASYHRRQKAKKAKVAA